MDNDRRIDFNINLTKVSMFFFACCLSLSVDSKGIFSKYYNDKIIMIDAVGSSKQRINGSLQMTKPEYSIYPWEKQYDWCSSCMRSYDEHPWISFYLSNRQIRLKGYYVRAGCCNKNTCCCEEKYYYCSECCLYSWSLQISNDNKTWTEVHRVDKDKSLRRCAEKSFELDKEYTTTYIRLIQNEACPGDPPCIALNKFELFGNVVGEELGQSDFYSSPDEDDDVSIIGHISKSGHVISD